MPQADTVVRAKWVVPVEPDGVVLEDHSVVVAGGRIADLGPADRIGSEWRADRQVHLDTHALLPGLVNAHTHAAMTLLRGLADDLPLKTWLEDHIWPAESRWVGREFVRDGTLLAAAEMLRGGVTCFADMYFFPEEVAAVARATGVRAVVGLIALEFPSAWASSLEEYLDKGLALYDDLDGDPLVRCALAPHAPYTVGDAGLEKVARLAEDLDLPVHTHVHETAAEVEESLAEHGCRPLERLARLGLVGPRLAAVHMTQLTSEELDRVASAQVSVVHCPESNLKLGSGFCPVAELQVRGVNLAIGSDGAASNNDLDLLAELRTASLLAKGVARDPTVVTAHHVLRMATLGGARALGLGDELGALTPGRWADLTAVDLGEPLAQPVYSPVSHLVYATGRHQVSDVWVAGQRLLECGELRTIDTERAAARAQEWRQRIAG